MRKEILNELNRYREIVGLTIIKEQEETQLEENMDDSNIDVEGVSGNQEDWSGEWNDLDKNIQDVYKQHKEFKDMDEESIRQKFNSMGAGPLCKIGRFLFGWVFKLGRSAFTKEMQSGMGGKHYKAWNCR
tara:strand:+ start:1168 stop:1557 length:390 start_codon:yes stop_codon:yes gene_type:complete